MVLRFYLRHKAANHTKLNSKLSSVFFLLLHYFILEENFPGVCSKFTFSLLHLIHFLHLFPQLFPNRILWITSTSSSSS